MSLSLWVRALAVAGALAPALLGAQTKYTVTQLSETPDQFSARSIGDDGTVMGVGGNRSFAWNASYGLVKILNLHNGVDGGVNAFDINNHGQIVGYVDTDNMPLREAFVWTKETGMALFHSFSTPASAQAINDKGQILALDHYFSLANPWLWSPGDTLSPYEPLDGIIAQPQDINDNGIAVGDGVDSHGVQQALMWVDGHIQITGNAPGKTNTVPAKVNIRNTTGGNALGGNGVNGYLRHFDGTYDIIPNPVVPNYASELRGLNDLDQAVGDIFVTNNVVDGIYWSRETGTLVLDDLLAPGEQAWHVERARGINNHGQITATAWLGSERHAVLLNPVPEPGMFVVFGVGLLAVVRRRRRR